MTSTLSVGGALKPTNVDNLWVHVACAWFQPQLAFASDELMEPAIGILSIAPLLFMKVIYVDAIALSTYVICLTTLILLCSILVHCSRCASFVGKYMVVVHNATGARLITMPPVHQGQAIEWRYN